MTGCTSDHTQAPMLLYVCQARLGACIPQGSMRLNVPAAAQFAP